MSVGIIGLGSIGHNLTLNIQKNNDVHVYDTTQQKIQDLVKKSLGVHGHESVCEMLAKMKTPRTIITALPAGNANDSLVRHMFKTLSPRDTIIDCSNEHYRISRGRGALCMSRQINYLGAGLSGGADGALHGPALMVGGSKSVYDEQKPFFQTFCKNVTYMGNGYGDGHYTKMIHNGVEYGMLQGMADVFSYCNQDQTSMMEVLDELLNSDIDGFLVKSAVEVLNKYKIHEISDVAEMNGTGLWCIQTALEYGIPTPVISSALNARLTSRYVKSVNTTQKQNIFFDRKLAAAALRFVFAASLAEGYELMSTRNIKKKKASKAWSVGTIIECPLVTADYHTTMDQVVEDARVFVMHCAFVGVPCPAVQAALNHYDFTHQRRTSLNFLMAQRNHFGNHVISQV